MILVTGASGFLGGRLARALVERGEQVRILARPSSNLDHLQGVNLEIARGDVTDASSLRPAVKDARIIYHCAGLSSDWAPWDRFYGTNVTGVRNLLEAATAEGKLDRFLHISTSDVYGYPEQACDEAHPITDIGLPYNRSKGQGETVVWEYHKTKGLPVTVMRPVSIYGPRSKDFVVEIAKLLAQKSMMFVSGGHTRAGLVYIDNAVDAIICGAMSAKSAGQAYNLRDESDATWRQYVDALADGLHLKRASLNIPAGLAFALGRAFEGVHGLFGIKSRPLLTRHSANLLCRDQGYSIAKIKRDLGFRSTVSFEQGVAKSVEWLDSAEGRALVKR